MVSFEPSTSLSSLPTPEELQKDFPLTQAAASFVLRSREAVESILNGWDSRRLLIVGPCSIHDLSSALEYAERFRKLSERVSDHFFMIMRTYFEKSRTILGWKGMLYDPDLDGSYNLAKGARLTRQLLAELTEMHIPTGSELLEINTIHYYVDFLTWGCVGARTCASPPHRQLAASLTLPIGFKNSVDGNIDQPIQGILAAAAPHVYLGLTSSGQMTRIQAEGNSLCHVVLRGGLSGPNYRNESMSAVVQKCRQAKVRDRLVVDCSHDNCGKKPLQQINVFESLVDQLVQGNSSLAGMMLESHLEGGSQELLFPLKYGVSVTDPCLDWESTERLILTAHERLQHQDQDY